VKILLALTLGFLISYYPQYAAGDMSSMQTIALPPPQTIGGLALETALAQRRSVRAYAPSPLSLSEIGQLAWAAQGITDAAGGLRTSPSAGATFPIEIDLLITGLQGVPEGVYRYLPREHALQMRSAGDRRRELEQAAMGQESIRRAPVVMAISGVTARTARRYGDRAQRYVFMEAGHVAQNVYLQAGVLGLGTVTIGAFRDEAMAAALGLGAGEQPLYLMPLGRVAVVP
jgi:SagB-type dehydrogenase family enzyme